MSDAPKAPEPEPWRNEAAKLYDWMRTRGTHTLQCVRNGRLIGAALTLECSCGLHETLAAWEAAQKHAPLASTLPPPEPSPARQFVQLEVALAEAAAEINCAVRKYGRHLYGCKSLGTAQDHTRMFQIIDPGPCDCGLDAALAAPAPVVPPPAPLRIAAGDLLRGCMRGAICRGTEISLEFEPAVDAIVALVEANRKPEPPTPSPASPPVLGGCITHKGTHDWTKECVSFYSTAPEASPASPSGEAKANPRNHGPCAECGQDIVIPLGEAWGLGEPKQHPWPLMCLVALKRAREAERQRADKAERLNRYREEDVHRLSVQVQQMREALDALEPRK